MRGITLPFNIYYLRDVSLAVLVVPCRREETLCYVKMGMLLCRCRGCSWDLPCSGIPVPGKMLQLCWCKVFDAIFKFVPMKLTNWAIAVLAGLLYQT